MRIKGMVFQAMGLVYYWFGVLMMHQQKSSLDIPGRETSQNTLKCMAKANVAKTAGYVLHCSCLQI